MQKKKKFEKTNLIKWAKTWVGAGKAAKGETVSFNYYSCTCLHTIYTVWFPHLICDLDHWMQDGKKVIREGETINIFSVASGHLYVRQFSAILNTKIGHDNYWSKINYYLAMEVKALSHIPVYWPKESIHSCWRMAGMSDFWRLWCWVWWKTLTVLSNFGS